VSRFLFFLLLLAALAFGAHLWLNAQATRPDVSAREINADAVRIVSVTPPVIAAQAVAERRRETQALAGAACVELSGIAAQDAARRFLASLAARGVHNAQVGPFTKELRGLAMLVREPDTETVARLAILQRDFPGTTLHAVACPAAEAKAAR
jgi:hypothetical protein